MPISVKIVQGRFKRRYAFQCRAKLEGHITRKAELLSFLIKLERLRALQQSHRSINIRTVYNWLATTCERHHGSVRHKLLSCSNSLIFRLRCAVKLSSSFILGDIVESSTSIDHGESHHSISPTINPTHQVSWICILQERTSIELPPQIWENIFCHLTPREWARASGTCSTTRYLQPTSVADVISKQNHLDWLA